jgi:lipopolysaccharide transport system ATP-binding protein
MSFESMIRAENLGKVYHIYRRPADRLKQMLWRGRRTFYDEYWALKEINLGIIGRNGSGKSTLLQLVCGTLAPTCGSVSVQGRIAALLELGAGFNPEFTGRENVYLSASVLGLSEEEIEDRFSKITEFAARFYRPTGEDLFQWHVCETCIRCSCARRRRHTHR